MLGEAAFAVNLFVALFALIDPVGAAPLFAAATAQVRPSARWRLALYVALFAFVFLTFFFFTGLGLLRFFGISLPAFRIAGGILLLLLGIDMAREDPKPQAASAIAGPEAAADPRAYALQEFQKLITPFAMPLLIGPGAISAVVIFASRGAALGWAGMAAGVAGLFAACLSIFVVFLAAGAISRVLGRTGLTIVVRVLGLILTALAVQFIIVGVNDATAGLIRRSVANPYPQHVSPAPARAG